MFFANNIYGERIHIDDADVRQDYFFCSIFILPAAT